MTMTHVEDFVLDLARPSDDLAIRRLLASSIVPGSVMVSSERSPDYFLSCATMGREYQVGVVRHAPSGEIVGLGYRGIQTRYFNGVPESIGYISDVVVDPRFQKRRIYLRLLRKLRELHADGRSRGYLIVVGSTNQDLLSNIAIETARRCLPRVKQVDQLWTLALIVRAARPPRPMACTVRRGSPADAAEIVAFLRREGARRQFFPVYDEHDFAPGSPFTHGFRVEDFLLACRDGRLVGMLGVWDRQAFKQTVVRGYKPPLGLLKPLYDGAARLLGAQPLPAPGEVVRGLYAGFVCIEHDDPEIFRSLLRQASSIAGLRGYAHLMVGLAASDPLLPVARRFLHIPYESHIYVVSYEGDPDLDERLDGRPAYVDLAAL